jgi:hypothetical protein
MTQDTASRLLLLVPTSGVVTTDQPLLFQESTRFPSGVALPIHAATDDHALGICIWEGESVKAVRVVVEGAVGPYAKNEYYEMHVNGLTPQLVN